MRKLGYVCLESYKARYTLQLQDWNERVFKARGIDYVYNFRSYAWQQYNKFSQGKHAKNMWDEDSRRFAGSRR